MLPIAAAAPLIGLAGQGAGALAGAAGQALSSVVDPSARAYNKQLRKDVDAMKRGKLGLSEAEKRTMLAGTQRALQAQTSGIEANLRRSAAAMGGFGRSGAQQAALGQMAAGQQEAVAKAAGGIDQQSQQKAEQRFQDIMGRLNQRRLEARQTGAQVGQGLQTYGADTATAAKTLRDKRLYDGALKASGLGEKYGLTPDQIAGLSDEQLGALIPQGSAFPGARQ